MLGDRSIILLFQEFICGSNVFLMLLNVFCTMGRDKKKRLVNTALGEGQSLTLWDWNWNFSVLFAFNVFA